VAYAKLPDMPSVRLIPALFVLVVLGASPSQGGAQPASGVGTRAQGMVNAFVGVADDASAVYWNPAGLAGGAFFSIVLDGGTAEAVPGGREEAGRRTGWFLAASMPALGITYYKLGRDAVLPVATPEGPGLRREALVTHHVGATLVQSLSDHVAVGATLKAIRGTAGAAVLTTRDRSFALHDVSLVGQSSSRFDLDAGVMASWPAGRLGLVVRNVVEPSFDTGAADALRLDREVRAGGSVVLLHGWRLASDVDLTRQRGPFGDIREWAVGTEAQVTSRLTARGGLRVNTVSDADRAPAFSAGGSYAVFGAVLVDVQVTRGADPAFSGWGIAGRLVF
jgi:hypothetical protein